MAKRYTAIGNLTTQYLSLIANSALEKIHAH